METETQGRGFCGCWDRLPHLCWPRTPGVGSLTGPRPGSRTEVCTALVPSGISEGEPVPGPSRDPSGSQRSLGLPDVKTHPSNLCLRLPMAFFPVPLCLHIVSEGHLSLGLRPSVASS